MIGYDYTENDPRSIDELVACALSSSDEEEAWDAVAVLHKRATPEVLARARELCFSEHAEERRLGANILGQLGVPERTHPVAAAATLRGMLPTENDVDVLQAILIAFSHNDFAGTVDIALEYAAHSDADVREAVVSALTGRDDRRAIEQLLTMMTDIDDEVRNWATFGIGTQSELDDPEIREALAARLDDWDEETRGEALIGLARRKDERAFSEIRRLLEEDPTDMVVEAAGLTELREFATALMALRGSDSLSSYSLESSITACSHRAHELN